MFRRKSLQKSIVQVLKNYFGTSVDGHDSLFQDINMDVTCLIYKDFIPNPIKNIHPLNARKFKMVVRNKRLETELQLETQFVLISCGCGWSLPWEERGGWGDIQSLPWKRAEGWGAG